MESALIQLHTHPQLPILMLKIIQTVFYQVNSEIPLVQTSTLILKIYIY